MEYTEFRQSIEERLAELADTEHNRKKKKIEADLDACLKQIEANKTAMKEALAIDQYDEAVTIDETISRLTSKSEFLKDTFYQLDSIPVYSDDDLRNLSLEVTKFFEVELSKNLKERLKILDKLDSNDQITEDILNQYNEIKSLIDKKTKNDNYDYGVSCGSAYYYTSCNDKHQLEQKIESLEKRVR